MQMTKHRISVYYLRLLSCPILKTCPSSWAAVAATCVTDEPVSFVKPADVLLHIVPTAANPTVFPARSIPLRVWVYFDVHESMILFLLT